MVPVRDCSSPGFAREAPEEDAPDSLDAQEKLASLDSFFCSPAGS